MSYTVRQGHKKLKMLINVFIYTHLALTKVLIVNEALPENVLSHYPNQCWIIVNWTPGNKLQWNLNRNSIIFIKKIILSRGDELIKASI